MDPDWAEFGKNLLFLPLPLVLGTWEFAEEAAAAAARRGSWCLLQHTATAVDGK
jgi:hypothetical protein